MKFVLTILILFLASCAHHPDVRPSAEGTHKVVTQAATVEEANREAIQQSQSYCKAEGKKAYIIQEDNKYSGKTIDEETYNTAKTTTQVLGAAGAIIGVLGGSTDSQKAGVGVGATGGIINQALGDGYTATMKFQCK